MLLAQLVYIREWKTFCGFAQTSCGVYLRDAGIENGWFLLAITASQRRDVLFDPYLFEARPLYLCFFLFPGCHAFQTRPQLSPVYLLRLVVSRPNGEFGRRICEKYRKFLHKQLKKICFKVRKWSEGNFPLFSDLPKQFPCSLKLFKNINCSLKVNGYVPLFAKTLGRPSVDVTQTW